MSEHLVAKEPIYPVISLLSTILILVVLVFKDYQNDRAVFTAVLLYNLLSLPFNLLYNYLFGREAMVAVATKTPWITVGMTLAVIALSALGAWIGIKIAKELKKSGVLKA